MEDEMNFCPICATHVDQPALAAHVAGHVCIELWIDGPRLTRPYLGADGELLQEDLPAEFETPAVTDAMGVAALDASTDGQASSRLDIGGGRIFRYPAIARAVVAAGWLTWVPPTDPR